MNKLKLKGSGKTLSSFRDGAWYPEVRGMRTGLGGKEKGERGEIEG